VLGDDGWALIPHEVLGGREAPQSKLGVLGASAASMRRFRRAAKRELARRG
jgi:hypothetical protein